MKLRADHIFAADNRGNRPAIVRRRDEVLGGSRRQLKGMYEISVLTALARRDVSENRVAPARLQRVPTHMRNFQIWIGRVNHGDIAADPAKALCNFVCEPARAHQLHPDTDAEKRPATPAYDFVKRLDHAVNAGEPALAI